MKYIIKKQVDVGKKPENQGKPGKPKKPKNELNKLNEGTKQFYSSSITMRGIFLLSIGKPNSFSTEGFTNSPMIDTYLSFNSKR